MDNVCLEFSVKRILRSIDVSRGRKKKNRQAILFIEDVVEAVIILLFVVDLPGPCNQVKPKKKTNVSKSMAVVCLAPELCRALQICHEYAYLTLWFLWQPEIPGF